MIIRNLSLLFSIFWLSICTANAETLNSHDKVEWTLYHHYEGQTLQFLIKAEPHDGWHISWDNPGDAGIPVTFDWHIPQSCNVRKKAQSAPKKFLYEDIISQYGYGTDTYYLFELSPAECIKEETLSLDINWTACRDYCEPDSLTLTVPATISRENDMIWETEYETAKKTFPEHTSLIFSAVNTHENLNLSIIDNGKFNVATENLYFIPYQKNIFSAATEQKIYRDKKGIMHIKIESESDTVPEQGGLLRYGDKTYELKYSPTVPLPLSLLFAALLAGIILNLMPCVFPVLSLKALSLQKHREKRSFSNGIMYMAGVICCFLGISAILYLLRLGGTAAGWGFQLQSPEFVTVMLVIFCIILMMMLDIIKINGRLTGYFDSFTGTNSFFTGFFAVLIASPCTGPLMGAVLGYALLQPAQIYFPVFLFLGFGYALPFTLLEFFPEIIGSILPKPGKWMVIFKRILALPIFVTCLWLGWVLHHQITIRDEVEDRLWKPYNQEKIERLIADGKPVFIDFTAKWCITCLFNEQTVLHTSRFDNLAKQKNITLFKADWTNPDEQITAGLHKYGRSGVPLYVFYPAGQTYKILPPLLTFNMIEQYLDGENQNDNTDHH